MFSRSEIFHVGARSRAEPYAVRARHRALLSSPAPAPLRLSHRGLWLLLGTACAVGCAQDDVRGGAEDASVIDAGNDAQTLPDGHLGTDSGDADGELPLGDGGTAAAADCDMNGRWMVKQLVRSEALGVGQFANYWYYVEMAQDGEDVVFTKQMDCDVRVNGSATVRVSVPTRRSLMGHNSQAGRRGTMKKSASGQCELAFERFWSVRGASEATFAPSPRSRVVSLADLRQTSPLPTRTATDGAEDWEDDGTLGIAWQVTGIVTGTRNSVQRDYTEWFTDATHTVTPALDFRKPLTLRVLFDNEENVLGSTSSLVASVAVADQTAEHRVVLSFLGRDATDPRWLAIAHDDPLDTCNAIVDALPAEDSL